MMHGISNRAEAATKVGHFKNGVIVSISGTKMFKFETDFIVSPDSLQVLNRATAGIRFMNRVHASRSNSSSIFIEFSPNMDENQMYRTALHYRGIANIDITRMLDAHKAEAAANSTTKDKSTKGSVRPKPQAVQFSNNKQ